MPLSTREERAEVDGLKTMTLIWGRVGEGEEESGKAQGPQALLWAQS